MALDAINTPMACGKGDHQHAGGIEEPFTFVSVDDLLEWFVTDIEKYRRSR